MDRPDLRALLHHRSTAGPQDAITDVPGVRVGHVTVTAPGVSSGVTAVVPAQLGPARMTLPAAVFTANGHGKLIGSTQVDELGTLETPVVLTSTLSAFRAADALVTWVLDRPEHASTVSLNPVVGECNDSSLSDIRSRPVTSQHVLAALDGASGEPPEDGSVGCGAGLRCLGFKGGVGSSSRTAQLREQQVTVGVLAQCNFGGRLQVPGRVVDAADWVPDSPAAQGNSCVLVVATDAPLDARQLGRLARRATYALGTVGAAYQHGSGDYAVAFSLAEPTTAPALDAELDPVFLAVLEAVQAAVLRALLSARTMTGPTGVTAHALPHAALAGLPGFGA